jgi:hypothetical protein
LIYAVELLGGIENAVARLGYRKKDLDDWMDGERAIPDSVFLAAADVVMNSKHAELHKAAEKVQKRLPAATPEELQAFLNVKKSGGSDSGASGKE